MGVALVGMESTGVYIFQQLGADKDVERIEEALQSVECRPLTYWRNTL
jgi:hypothetical protein